MDIIYEIAYGDARNRGHFIEKEKLANLYKGNFAQGLVYKSVYGYDKGILEHKKEFNSVSKYKGIRYIEDIVFDIDKGVNSDSYTRKKCITLIQYLESLGIDDNEYQIYFSGRGFHIHTSNIIWGFKPSEDLPYIVKETIKKVLSKLEKGFYDESIYMATGMFRLKHTKNIKSGLFKIPITKNELLYADDYTFLKLASCQRLDFNDSEYYEEILASSENKLANFIIKNEEVPKEDIQYSKQIQKSNVACCIHKLIDRGASEGNRNNALLRIASHSRRNNIPEDFLIAGLIHNWNEKNGCGLDKETIVKSVKKTYRSPYNYGCNDSMLKAYCSTECIFYGNKNYAVDTITNEMMSEELKSYRDMDTRGRTLDLAKILGIKKKDNPNKFADMMLEPGDFLLIVGNTGTNKTTLIQQITLGIDFTTGEMHEEYKMETLFIELELTTAKLMRRNTQVICKVSKEEALEHYDKYEKQVLEATNHIALSRKIRTIAALRQEIIQHNYKMIIIDYLQCFKPIKSEGFVSNNQTLLDEVVHGLRDLATDLGVIIIALSQIPLSAKKEKFVTMDSSKGSGDAGDASTSALTINGDKETIYRNVKIEKMTDGETCIEGIMMQFNPETFRLERI